MNQVYVFNDNADNAFLSILMNDLSNRDISFNNIKSTKTINYNNILVYIPFINSTNHLNDFLRNSRNNLFKFKRIMVVCNCMNDYNEVKSIHNTSYSNIKFRHYCGIAFDTLLSRVIADDCDRAVSSYR